MKDQFLIGHINPTFPEKEHLKCPRCDSSNTKFCYYNNYNLSQPRHYCRNCKRYWTKGGVLRNIPVGGGSRKNIKRSKATKGSSSTSAGAATITSSSSSSIAALETESSSSLKKAFDQDCKLLDLNGENLDSFLLDETNKNVHILVSDSGSEEVRNVDQENSNSTTTSCWSRGNWPDLAM